MTAHELTVRFEDDVDGIPYAQERTLFAEELRRNPGRVALLGTSSSSGSAKQRAYLINHALENMHMFAPAGSFEAAARTMFGTSRIYVRYVGIAAP